MEFTFSEKQEIILEVMDLLNKNKGTDFIFRQCEEYNGEFFVYFDSASLYVKLKKFRFAACWFDPEDWSILSTLIKVEKTIPPAIRDNPKKMAIAKIAAWWWSWYKEELGK